MQPPEPNAAPLVTVVWPAPDAEDVAQTTAEGPSAVRQTAAPHTQSEPALSQDEPAPTPSAPQIIEPQREWDWTVATYLHLVGLGCGAFAAAVVTDWFGLGFHPAPAELTRGWSWDWPQVFVWWGPAAAAAGTIFLLVHLGENWLLLPTAWRNWRAAWMARGFVILALFIAVGMVVAAIAVLAPRWASHLPLVWRLLQGVGLTLALATAAYTGVLLWSKSYIPAWATALVPCLFVASAFASGLAGLVLGVVAYQAVATSPRSAGSLIGILEGTTVLFIFTQAGLLVLYVRRLRNGGPQARSSADRLVHGALGTTFWVPVIGGGLVLPLVLIATEAATGASLWAAASAVSVLIGAFFLRLAVLRIGIREAPPLYTLSEWRGDHPADSPSAASSVPAHEG